MHLIRPIARILTLAPAALSANFGYFGGGGRDCCPVNESTDYATLDDGYYYGDCGWDGVYSGGTYDGGCSTGACGIGGGAPSYSAGPGYSPSYGGEYQGASCPPQSGPYYSEREYPCLNVGDLDTSVVYYNQGPAQSGLSYPAPAPQPCGPGPIGGGGCPIQGGPGPQALEGGCPTTGVTLVMNGEVPVSVVPQSVTVGQTTYPLSNPAVGGGSSGITGVTVSNLHSPGEIAAGLVGSGMTPEQMAQAEAAAAAANGTSANATNASKKGKKGKKGSKKGGATKKRKSGAAGISALSALAVLPLALFLM